MLLIFPILFNLIQENGSGFISKSAVNRTCEMSLNQGGDA
jgi:hypothetical protein